MSGGRRRGGRSGISTRVAGDVVGRIRTIRALWFAVQNDPKYSIEDLSSEFFFAVGEVFEGRTLRTLSLTKIDRSRVSQHAEE